MLHCTSSSLPCNPPSTTGTDECAFAFFRVGSLSRLPLLDFLILCFEAVDKFIALVSGIQGMASRASLMTKNSHVHFNRCNHLEFM